MRIYWKPCRNCLRYVDSSFCVILLTVTLYRKTGLSELYCVNYDWSLLQTNALYSGTLQVRLHLHKVTYTRQWRCKGRLPMETQKDSRGIALSVLNSPGDRWGGWSMSTPVVITVENSIGTNCRGGRTSHRAGLDDKGKIKFLPSIGARTSARPTRRQSLYCLHCSSDSKGIFI